MGTTQRLAPSPRLPHSRTALLALALVATATAASAGLGGLGSKVLKVKDKAADVNVKIDDEQERFLGRAVAADLIGRFGLVDDPELTTYIATLGTYLANFSSHPEFQYRFAVLDSDVVNAFAAPAGFIFVTRGALATARDEGELAAILAHEIIHASERHVIRSIESSYRKKVILSGLAEAAASRVGADPKLVQAFGELTSELTDNLLTGGLDRKLELQADAGAAQLLAAAGYDPQALVDMLGRLPADKEIGAVAKTHPAASDRIKQAKSTIDKNNLQPRPEARYPELFAAKMHR